MKKVLIIQNRIAEYRVPIFNLLAQQYHLTICYSDGPVPAQAQFEVVQRKNHRGKVFWHFENGLSDLIKKNDIMIVPMDTRQLDYHLAMLAKRIKVISWGIGVKASYDVPFDSGTRRNILEKNYFQHSDACLFYSQYPIDKLREKGYSTKKFFVANNTVEVKKQLVSREKNSIIFIGTLYAQKRIYDLLEAYHEACLQDESIPNLVIIGDGEERTSIEEYIKSYKLERRITLTGAIFDEDQLVGYFERAIACFSPNQAGLSVLKSMGYGVPFITHRDSITGGERLNITHMVNGVLFEKYTDMRDIIIDIAHNREKYLSMGENAYHYYWTKRTPEMMVEGFVSAIEYVSTGSSGEKGDDK